MICARKGCPNQATTGTTADLQFREVTLTVDLCDSCAEELAQALRGYPEEWYVGSRIVSDSLGRAIFGFRESGYSPLLFQPPSPDEKPPTE